MGPAESGEGVSPTWSAKDRKHTLSSVLRHQTTVTQESSCFEKHTRSEMVTSAWASYQAIYAEQGGFHGDCVEGLGILEGK